MSNAPNEKPVPQVALEVMMKRNKEAADKLLAEAKKLIEENRHISVEMSRILPPPSSRSVPSAGSAATLPASGRYAMMGNGTDSRNQATMPPASRPDPMGGLLHAADALVRSWKRRKKKNFKQLELDLMTALERMNVG